MQLYREEFIISQIGVAISVANSVRIRGVYLLYLVTLKRLFLVN